jgi:hypothetical protein
VGAVNGDPREERDVGEYCRQIEAHLCARNGGHLIRIAGPSFTRVCGWAARGIPLKVACRGIDRYVERYQARGPRRRPVLIDFCEADVLDVFDEWRRAVGAPLLPAAGESDAAAAGRLSSLPLHLDRAIARLTALRAGGQVPAELDRALDAAARELDLMRGDARRLRGEARAAALARLAAIDGQLLEAARAAAAPEELEAFAREAAEDLRPFQDRMTAATFDSAVRAATDRLLRERHGLPRIEYGH